MAEIVKKWESGDVIATLRKYTLTISGSGRMADYEWKDPAPWNKESVINVVIEDGVTEIGKYAFHKCVGLRTVEIGNSVQLIGEDAFSFCKHLKSIKIGDGVTHIGNSAFGYCGITSILLPESLKTIGDSAFGGCSSLKEINIPCNTESIGNYAFSSCSNLKSLLIPESVRVLGYDLLRWTNSLKTLINESIVPQRVNIDTPTLRHHQTTFGEEFCTSVTLYVPASAIDLYKTGEWSPFKTILPIEKLGSGDESLDNQMQQLEGRLAEIEEERTKLTEEVSYIEKQIEEIHLKKLLLRGLKGNPKHVAEFMSLFNQRDGLKYLTHDIDGSEDFDYEEVLSLVRKVCTENFEEKEIPSTLRELFNQFMFEESPRWKTFDKDYNELEMTSGWSSGDWSETRNSNLHPIKQPRFAEIIRNFKRLTRIESPYLETLVNKVFADDTYKVNTKDLSKADFYTRG